jgi:hypothetical protein
MSIFAEATVTAAKDPTTFHIINNTVASKYLLLWWSPVVHICSTPWWRIVLEHLIVYG